MKATLTLSDDGMNKTQEIEITAYKTDDPALIVHKQTWVKNGEVVQGKSWIVAHKPTGLVILKGYTKRDYAIEGASKLAELARWDGITIENAPDWYSVNKEYVIEIVRDIR